MSGGLKVPSEGVRDICPYTVLLSCSPLMFEIGDSRLVTLSPVERLMLANQFRILNAVDPDYASFMDLEKKIEALESGFEVEYASVLGRFGEDTLASEECLLVNDMMLLATWLLEYKGKTSLKVEEFAHLGFDGNNEAEHLAYARFLYKHHGEDKGFPGVKAIFNSHHQTLPRYRRMVAEWIARGRDTATEADVAAILAAGGGFTAEAASAE